MKTITITLPFDQDLKEYLKSEFPLVVDYKILGKSLDARKAQTGKKPVYLYQLSIIQEGEKFAETVEEFTVIKISKEQRPIIIGSGPAGLFCAIRLAEYGINSIIIERGDRVPERMKKIAKYWRYGELDLESNVCFGEGGAGLYSDGKLITRIKSEFINYVMRKFVHFGAPKDTEYMANPHLGSNKIRTLINVMTKELENKGCEFRYQQKVVDFIFDENKKIKGVLLDNGEVLNSSHVVVATGHSAREIYHTLFKHQVAMRPKDFAIGVRIEHQRKYIDELQYGSYAENSTLGAARYRLAYHDKETDRGTYSFCMCPGGYVLASSTDKHGIVTNGMSNNTCSSAWSNAALVVSVKTEKDCDTFNNGVLAGLDFIEGIEKKAYELSKKYATGKEIPAQKIEDFLSDRVSTDFPKTSTPSHLVAVKLSELFPSFVIEHLKNALFKFDANLEGFGHDAILMAPETRTSAPVTVLRNDQDYESVSHPGLYPAGEGAGYAGGITSAAVDGVKIAESIRKKLQT